MNAQRRPTTDATADDRLALVAAAIAEPARARMLCCLMDGHARTATELAAVADVAASTASVHLARLKAQQLVDSVAQGRHRYFRLHGAEVARAIEALLVIAGPAPAFRSPTPEPLRAARTCYDHMAGTLAVALHDRLLARRWLKTVDDGYQLTAAGSAGVSALGIDIDAARATRRRFACPCMDWSERRPHLAGAIGAALLGHALAQRWVRRELDGRALAVLPKGLRELSNIAAS